MVPQLTSGVIWACMNGEEAPLQPCIQILSFKKVGGQGNQDHVCLHISDGEFSHSTAMLATQLDKHIFDGEIEPFAVVKVKKMMHDRNKFILEEIEVVAKGSEVGMKIGNPTAWVDGMSRLPAAKKLRMENMDLPTGAVVPIQDLNPYNNPVTIRARVIHKGDVITWSKPRGEGKRFSIDLLDQTGEIRMTAFKTEVDVFFPMFQVDRVYYIRKFSVKAANKQFTSNEHQYELTFEHDTQVIPCVEDTSDVPRVTHDFVSIADIEHVDVNKIIDVMGVCKSFERLRTTKDKKTGEKRRRRELVLFDQSGKEIALTLWGKRAQEFRAKTQPIIVVKGVKVSVFDGKKSLSCLPSSSFRMDPDLPQVHALRLWRDGNHILRALLSD